MPKHIPKATRQFWKNILLTVFEWTHWRRANVLAYAHCKDDAPPRPIDAPGTENGHGGEMTQPDMRSRTRVANDVSQEYRECSARRFMREALSTTLEECATSNVHTLQEEVIGPEYGAKAIYWHT